MLISNIRTVSLGRIHPSVLLPRPVFTLGENAKYIYQKDQINLLLKNTQAKQNLFRPIQVIALFLYLDFYFVLAFSSIFVRLYLSLFIILSKKCKSSLGFHKLSRISRVSRCSIFGFCSVSRFSSR